MSNRTKTSEAFLQKHAFKILALLLILTFFVYSPALKNSFTRWDDSTYVLENPYVKSLSVENMQAIFTRPYQGNYVPLTFLSFSVNYFFSGPSPAPYILTNILLHLLTVLFVFLFISALTKNRIMGLVVSFLFALNPIHSESVVWIAERKDVLYGSFFFLSLYFYIIYLKNDSRRYYIISLFIFLLACLSKSSAATLSISLFAIDLFLGRKVFSRKVLLEKAPFLSIGLLFLLTGMLAVRTGATALTSYDLNGVERTAIASFNLINYLLKTVCPVGLSAYYPYPFSPGEDMPAWAWIYPLAVAAAAAILIFFRKNRFVVFGALFFLLNIFLALQLFPVGDAVMADRFVYAAATGIYFVAAKGILLLVERNKPYVAGGILMSVLLLFAYGTGNRCKVWKNDETLWSDVILKNKNVPMAYVNRGAFYFSAGRHEEAIRDLSEAASRKKNDKDAYYNRGVAYLALARYEEAEADFTSALSVDPVYADALFNRALCRSLLNRLELADEDFSDFLKLRPQSADAYSERGLVRYKLKKINEATDDLGKAISIDPKQPDAFARRGYIELEKGDTTSACNDLHAAYALGSVAVKELIEVNCR